jgi:hypothetical protein
MDAYGFTWFPWFYMVEHGAFSRHLKTGKNMGGFLMEW